ncbi:MAG: FAD-dependent oxidoreductase, partial [SAR202 cluster bacterium]|nr:FAD-dependent oxidoreductase [SAR202 cluster bacterium]
EAKTAIVTLPVGVMQTDMVKFAPKLPEQKRAAIAGLRMGPTIKVIGEFKRPFWDKLAGRGPGFRAEGSVFHWFEDIFWDRPGPAVLSAMIGRFGAELSGDEGRIHAAYFSELARMFPGEDIEKELVSAEVVDWVADRWARGSLSVAAVGGQRLRTDLAAPTPPLFWAGEAANTWGNAMSVHGALESGRRAAVEVLHAVRPLHSTDPDSRLDWWKHTTIPGEFIGGR